MGFYADVLALSPAVMWKGELASGTNVPDASGNSRDGTLNSTTGVLYAQTSIIPAEPTSASIYLPGGSIWIARNDESALDPGTSFTAIISLKPADLAAQRDIIGKLDSWQVWLETTGQITGYFTPAWTAVLSSNNTAGKLVTGQADLIFIRQDAAAAKASVWIRGVKVGEVTKSNALTNTALSLRMGGSSNSGAGRSIKGNIQCFAYWPTTALSDAQLGALYTSWATAPPASVAPDAPAITSPAGGSTVDRSLVLTVEDVSATGSGTTLQYKVEREVSAGAGWVTLVDWTSTRPNGMAVNTSAWPAGSDHRLRAYARWDTVSSAAGAITTITVVHVTNIEKPEVSWVWTTPEQLGFYASAFSTDVLGASYVATHWRLQVAGGDITSPLLSFSRSGAFARFGISGEVTAALGWDNAKLLAENSDYEVQCRYEDDIGGFSEWSDIRKGRTARKSTLVSNSEPLLAEDFTGSGRNAAYKQSCSDAGTPACMGAAIQGVRFPTKYLIPPATAHDADLAVMNDNQELLHWDEATAFGGDSLSHIRQDSQSGAPDFGILLRGFLLQWAPTPGFGILSLSRVSTGAFQVYQRTTTDKVYIAWLAGGVSSEVLTSAVLAPGAPFTLRISHKLDGSTSKFRVNGSVVLASGVATLSAAITQGLIGHHSAVGPTLAGAFHMLFGALTDYAVWWNEPLDYLTSADLPAVEGLPADPSPDEILATSPVMYYKLGDPRAPNKPVLSKA